MKEAFERVEEALMAAGVVGGLGAKRAALAAKIVEEGDADRVDVDAAQMLRDEARRQGTKAIGVWVLTVLDDARERRIFLQTLQGERARRAPSVEPGTTDRKRDTDRRVVEKTAEELQGDNDRKAMALFRGEQKTPQQVAEFMGDPLPVTLARVRRVLEIDKPDPYEPLTAAEAKRDDKFVATEVAREKASEREHKQHARLIERLDREASSS